MYSLRTSVIILCMIVTGALRSVGVKLFYQLGFDNPLFVTMLYLTGQSLAIVVYWLSHIYHWKEEDENHPQDAQYAPLNIQEDEHAFLKDIGGKEHFDGDEIEELEMQTMKPNEDDCAVRTADIEASPTQLIDVQQFAQMTKEDDSIVGGNRQDYIVSISPHDSKEQITKMIDQSVDNHIFSSEHRSLSMPINDSEGQLEATNGYDNLLPRSTSLPLESGTPVRGIIRRGSKTGLTDESSNAVDWIHHIPWQLKPAIPGFFNLCNAALRWGSLSYVAASICDMLMTGSELVLSVIAARVIRKRHISQSRWAGVAVVTVGLLIIRAADVLDSDAEMKTMNIEDAARLKREHFIGAILIIGQSVTAVCQDMAEELFLHEADFPATLLLGMEGMFGLFFGFPLYLKYAPETLSETWATLQSSALKKNYVMGLVCLFTFTGVFNIMATGVTSSMTRNMWKNFRTIFVWTLGLVIFYAWGNVALGEAWVIPDSFFTLIGFSCMLSGIYIYYKNK